MRLARTAAMAHSLPASLCLSCTQQPVSLPEKLVPVPGTECALYPHDVGRIHRVLLRRGRSPRRHIAVRLPTVVARHTVASIVVRLPAVAVSHAVAPSHPSSSACRSWPLATPSRTMSSCGRLPHRRPSRTVPAGLLEPVIVSHRDNFLYVCNSRCRLDKYLPYGPSSQCGNCCKFGHPTSVCQDKAPTCGVCAKEHATRFHPCSAPDCRGGLPCLLVALQVLYYRNWFEVRKLDDSLIVHKWKNLKLKTENKKYTKNFFLCHSTVVPCCQNESALRVEVWE